MRQISIVSCKRAATGVYSRVGRINKDREEESKGGGDHGRREPSKRVQVHFPLRNFENKNLTWTSLFRWSFSDPCWT